MKAYLTLLLEHSNLSGWPSDKYYQRKAYKIETKVIK